MATANRVFWETVTVIALVLAIFAVWSGSRWMAKRQIRQAEAEQQASIEERRAQLDEEASQVKRTAEQWAEELALSEAEAVFRSFSAGIHYAANERWGRVLGDAREQFERVPRVKFAHLMTPGGRPVFTTHADLFSSGTIDESGGWAMGSNKLRSRAGDTAGITELAGPVAGGTILWIGYDTAAAKRTGQPASFGGEAPDAPETAPTP